VLPLGLHSCLGMGELFDPCASQFNVFFLLILFANGALWGGCSWGLGLGQGGLVGAHPPLEREPRAKCKSWWVKGKTRQRPFSWGGCLLLSAPREGEWVPFIWEGEVPLRQPWVAGEEPIREGERADAGCFRHDSRAAGAVGPGGGSWEQGDAG